jgi:hypothetical protein
MSGYSGFTNAAAQMGLQALIIKPAKRGMYNITLPDGSTAEWDIKAHATIEELHTDDLEITEHPVEQGANIADHAFKRPAEVVLKLAWSNSPPSNGSLINAALGAAATVSPQANALAKLVGGVSAAVNVFNQYQNNKSDIADTPSNTAYQTLLYLQSSRSLFDVYTGRRHYTNMVCKSLAVQNDFKTENALYITVTCRQVILVNTATVRLAKLVQKNPQTTTQRIKKGAKQAITK